MIRPRVSGHASRAEALAYAVANPDGSRALYVYPLAPGWYVSTFCGVPPESWPKVRYVLPDGTVLKLLAVRRPKKGTPDGPAVP